MAVHTRTVLTDDFDASTDGVTSHEFAFDGVTWEIDPSVANLDRLREALRPFQAAGRRQPASCPPPGRADPRRRPGGHQGDAPLVAGPPGPRRPAPLRQQRPDPGRGQAGVPRRPPAAVDDDPDQRPAVTLAHAAWLAILDRTDQPASEAVTAGTGVR